jgi:exopolyphosphatase/guanosine-5'-triphosphate,3'-diphosphate pyrophosphatase
MLGIKQLDPIKLNQMIKLRNELDKLTLDQRVERYQLKPDRADVIIPACDIYAYIFKELKVSSFQVPKIGLADGMIYDLYLKTIQASESVIEATNEIEFKENNSTFWNKISKKFSN